MGDLNFAPESAAYFELAANENPNLVDTYRSVNSDPGYTFRSNSRFKRIDYIFCSSDLIPISSRVICSTSSDHCAVVTTF
ncbi:MAG: endonuclease/exonuclease/phosphatase family protein [Candidatus Hermodarchaeota archaeon]